MHGECELIRAAASRDLYAYQVRDPLVILDVRLNGLPSLKFASIRPLETFRSPA
jgi:hypothetical protein